MVAYDDARWSSSERQRAYRDRGAHGPAPVGLDTLRRQSAFTTRPTKTTLGGPVRRRSRWSRTTTLGGRVASANERIETEAPTALRQWVSIRSGARAPSLLDQRNDARWSSSRLLDQRNDGCVSGS